MSVQTREGRVLVRIQQVCDIVKTYEISAVSAMACITFSDRMLMPWNICNIETQVYTCS